ncbi:uncharacterized protein [Rhodnius prolixus]|uniref:uncharacterized protein n=1 Tax=Rhodnius prolixus TaxID=13249 RepID=UPI003D18BE4F
MQETSRQKSVMKDYLRIFDICAFYVQNDRWAKMFCIYLTIYHVFTLILMINSFIIFIPDIDKMAVLFHHFTVVGDMAAHVLISYYYRPTIKRLIEGIYETHDYESELIDEFAAKVQDERLEKSKEVLKGNYFACFLTCIMIFLAGVFDRYVLKKTERFLLIPMVFFVSIDTWTGYSLLLIWQFFGMTYAVCMLFCLFDFLHLFYIKIVTEFKILDYALSTVKERAAEIRESNEKKYNKTLDHKMGDYYEESIKHCVIHHIQIISIFHSVRDTEKWMYFIGIAVNLGLLVCTGLTLVTDDVMLKVKFLVIMGITMVYVFFFFWMGQDISDASENILLTLHTADWLDMPKRCRSTLHLIMTRTMKPLIVTSIDGTKITTENFMALVSAAYSYFNTIIQMKG